ncbi:hypothetical protein BASA83_005323 [Batrachochytrium salamandrivorans]|nr:hypothetical protein BASA83_005323 [Batrachochytrium salamandrivorans]
MKFRTLVVAAMAITSVNAAGSGGLLGCFGRICRSRPNQKFEPKTDLICDPIVYEFRALWITIYDFDYKFSQEMTEFYNLIAGKKDDLKIEKLREWIGSNPKAIPKLKEIRTVYIGLEKNYSELWERIVQKGCQNERFERISPLALKTKGYFPQWYSRDGVDIFDEA